MKPDPVAVRAARKLCGDNWASTSWKGIRYLANDYLRITGQFAEWRIHRGNKPLPKKLAKKKGHGG